MVETHIIDGKVIAKDFRAQVAAHVRKLGSTPRLAVILVGEHPASLIYVQNKQKAAQEVGIDVDVYQLSPTVAEKTVLDLIAELNAKQEVNGILLQLPVPPHLDSMRLIEAIDPQKDVDGLHPENVGKMVTGQPAMIPCTPLGCVYLLQQVHGSLAGKHAVVVGRSALVGRPLAQLLLRENCTVTQAHSKTVDLAHVCRQGDILVSAVGKPGLITKDFVKEGATVIDVGINRLEDGKIVGDVLFLDMMGRAAHVTPVPGGVGPMTIAMLLFNVVKAADQNLSNATDLIPF